MKLNELYNVISESEALWINAGSTTVCYDGRNSIDESFNNLDVKCITVGGDGILTIEVKDIAKEVEEAVSDMDEYDLKCIWNNYCEAINCDESHIYDMDEFDDCFYSSSPSDIARMVQNSSFDIADEFFKIGIYDEVNSANMVDDLIDDIEALCDYIVENEDALGSSTLERIIG